MKLCCGSNLYASFPLETALREMSKIGFRYVDLWACKAICCLLYTSPSPRDS